MYAGDVFSPPRGTVDDLKLLVASDSALVFLREYRAKPAVLKVHPWPSWLTRGSPKVVNFFLSFFY